MPLLMTNKCAREELGVESLCGLGISSGCLLDATLWKVSLHISLGGNKSPGVGVVGGFSEIAWENQRT